MNEKNKFCKKVLALDIDGTLVNSKKEMTPATVSSLKKMMAAGHILILASGRPTTGMLRYARELELDKFGGYILSYNGALVLKGDEVIIDRPLPAGIPGELYEFALSHGTEIDKSETDKSETDKSGTDKSETDKSGTDKSETDNSKLNNSELKFSQPYYPGLVTFRDNFSISAFEPNEYVIRQAGNNQFGIKVVPQLNKPDYSRNHDTLPGKDDFSGKDGSLGNLTFPEYVNFPVYKCMIMDEGSRLVEYEKELHGIYGDKLSIYRSEDYFLEVMNSGINKADTLAQMVKMMGMDRENLICAGDGFNDISMIKYAGVGVAMGNAKECVKEAADFVAPSNEEDGISWIINNLVMT